MCESKAQYQRVNPTTQVALYSLCLETCSPINNIIWNIYQGTNNVSSSMINWTPFNETNHYDDIWFFGRNTTNFTTIPHLFLENPRIQYWRFEVVYSLSAGRSSGSIDFALNQPPANGSCSIDPLDGTTSTLFSIICSNWSHSDRIKDYSIYIWTDDRSKSTLVSFTVINHCQLHLPAGNDNTSVIHLFARIRDRLGAITEFNMSSVTVLPDTAAISNLIDTFQSSHTNTNPLVELLASGNVNAVGQVISSVSQILNEINTQNIKRAVSSGGVSATSISITSLDSDSSSLISVPWNESNPQINNQANLRDYLMSFARNLIVGNADLIEIQASSLAQLTQATNQLTRSSALLASKRCHQLAVVLHAMRLKISYESVKATATQISTCATNVLTAIHGPLQGRMKTIPDADGTHFEEDSAERITFETTQTISLLTFALNAHLNIGQNLTMSSSSIFVSLETRTLKSISNRSIEQMGNGRILIPSNFDQNQTISLRSMIQPLAIADQSQSRTHLSRAISLSIFDQDGKEISIKTNSTNPFEIIIPRDPNIQIPDMFLQDVLSNSQEQFFNLHQIDITSTLTISVHFEIQPLNPNMSYLFIYKFDGIPQWNSNRKIMDGWTVFCSSNLANGTIYQYFLDNEQTSGHRSMTFGLRELDLFENCSHLSLSKEPPMIHEKSNFTSNYQLRIYTSGCYYLDENNQWQSDGLKVGPLTNHYQTQCFSTHI